jgi:ribosome-interacting GTPase 1
MAESCRLVGPVVVLVALLVLVAVGCERSALVPYATSLAATFREHDYNLQMISLPGPWHGFSKGQVIHVMLPHHRTAAKITVVFIPAISEGRVAGRGRHF